MKLTKSQRHEAYKVARRRLKRQILAYSEYFHAGEFRHRTSGICVFLQEEHRSILKSFSMIHHTKVPEVFPEFGKFQPRNKNKLFWWTHTPQGNAAMIRALDKCIEATAPEKVKQSNK